MIAASRALHQLPRGLFLSAVTIAAAAGSAYGALSTELVASGLNRPIYVTSPPNDSRLFIIEQRGIIKVVEDGELLPTPFLNIDQLIPDITGNDERGLLGLAFHPGYAANGFFYVNYVNLANDTVIARYHVSANPNTADPTSSTTILFIDQPSGSVVHKGGHLAFGPFDGYLYIGMGDGNDPGSAQSDMSLLGKILRIDVDSANPYAIPPDNPYVGSHPGRDEVWAKGLRNPYRWSFDRTTGDLYIADVGHGCWEEIDFQPAASSGGENYGWVVMEGSHCFNPQGCTPPSCNMNGLVFPIHEYSHGGVPFRCSVTGGYVYRGNAIPRLRGTYFFADFCSRQIWSFRYEAQKLFEFTDRTAELAPEVGEIANIAGIGEDAFGEIYFVDRDGATIGEVYKLAGTLVGVAEESGTPSASSLRLSTPHPNPFTNATRFAVELDRPGPLTLTVYDTGGRLVRRLAANTPGAGHRLFTWDGIDVRGRPCESGVYYLRAEAEGEARTRRLCLVR